MPTTDYYRRQALSSLNLARVAINPEIKRQLIELAYQLMARAAAEDQLNPFTAKS
jgi:hypothetical protein